MLGRAFGVMHLWGSGGREEQGAVTGWNGLESHEEGAADQPGQEGVLPEGVLPSVLLTPSKPLLTWAGAGAGALPVK